MFVKLDWDTRKYAVYNVALSGTLLLIVLAFESSVMALVLQFINTCFGQLASGYSPTIAIYFGIFIFGIVFQFVGSVDAYYGNNTMQVAAVAIFNFLTVAYSLARIIS